MPKGKNLYVGLKPDLHEWGLTKANIVKERARFLKRLLGKTDKVRQDYTGLRQLKTAA